MRFGEVAAPEALTRTSPLSCPWLLQVSCTPVAPGYPCRTVLPMTTNRAPRAGPTQVDGPADFPYSSPEVCPD
jgi:hypothetical protein